VRHLGDAHQDLDQHGQAESCYREALSLYRAGDSRPLDLANAIRSYALLKECAGQHEEARELWAEARTLYASVNASGGVDECTSHLQDLGD
jgi:tetratricopeptide (TPR) repeat protein